MKTRAAVALEKGKPLTITDVELEGPKASEVLVEVKATGICHTDEFTLSGADPEGLFPAVLGHEGQRQEAMGRALRHDSLRQSERGRHRFGGAPRQHDEARR